MKKSRVDDQHSTLMHVECEFSPKSNLLFNVTQDGRDLYESNRLLYPTQTIAPTSTNPLQIKLYKGNQLLEILDSDPYLGIPTTRMFHSLGLKITVSYGSSHKTERNILPILTRLQNIFYYFKLLSKPGFFGIAGFIFFLFFFQTTNQLWPLSKMNTSKFYDELKTFGTDYSEFTNSTFLYIANHQGEAPLSIHFLLQSPSDQQKVLHSVKVEVADTQMMENSFNAKPILFAGNNDLSRHKQSLLPSQHTILYAESEKLTIPDSHPLTTILNDEFAHYGDFDTQFETTHIIFLLFSYPKGGLTADTCWTHEKANKFLAELGWATRTRQRIRHTIPIMNDEYYHRCN